MKILLSSSAAGCYLLVAALATAGAQNNNVVTACVSKSTSKARVVSSASNCDTATETVVLWNLTGPQGSPGPVGATGSTGAVGPAGSQGPIGIMGATGAAGPQGKVGRAGMTGPVGAQGPLGSTGAAGPQGSQGPAGYSAMPVIEWFTASSYVVPQSGIGDSTTRYKFALSCPDQSVLVGSGCGPLQGHDYIVQHVGPDTNSGVTNTGTKVQTMSCTVYGGANSSEAQTILYSAGCLANRTSNYSENASAMSKTYSTCTYDPDTQQPCTRADAVVTSPAAAMTANPTAAQVTAAKTLASRDNAQQQATVAAGQPTPKVTHKLKTLWFEN